MTLSVLLKRKKKLSGLKKRRSNWSSFKSKTTSYGIITLLSYRNRNLRDLNFKKLCEILRTEARMMQKKKKQKKKTVEFTKTHFLPGIKKGGRHQGERSAHRYSMLFPMEIFQSNVHKKERWCRPCRYYYTLAASDEKGNERPAKTTKADKSREMDEIKLDFFKEAVKPASQESNNSISLFVKSLES